MTSQEDIITQQDLLTAHRRTLAHYLKQQALLGAPFIPPAVAHGILDARENIQRIKNILGTWGIEVEDHPDDESPKQIQTHILSKSPLSAVVPVTDNIISEFITIEHPFHLILIRIPAGEFIMGSDRSRDKHAADDEMPQHTVYLPEYYITKYPITNSQYTNFKQIKIGESKLNHPVIMISWKDAVTFCKWLSLQTGKLFRLPTEAEWEKSARGIDGRIYPWGDQWNPRKCNNGANGVNDTTLVGKYSPSGDSPYGVADMSGNVWEWCQSKKEDYPCTGGDIDYISNDDWYVIRGGSWDGDGGNTRTAYRAELNCNMAWNTSGFRIVMIDSV